MNKYGLTLVFTLGTFLHRHYLTSTFKMVSRNTFKFDSSSFFLIQFTQSVFVTDIAYINKKLKY